MPAQCTSQTGGEGRVTFKHIIQVEELLFIIQVIINSILLTTWAFGCSSPVMTRWYVDIVVTDDTHEGSAESFSIRNAICTLAVIR